MVLDAKDEAILGVSGGVSTVRSGAVVSGCWELLHGGRDSRQGAGSRAVAGTAGRAPAAGQWQGQQAGRWQQGSGMDSRQALAAGQQSGGSRAAGRVL